MGEKGVYSGGEKPLPTLGSQRLSEMKSMSLGRAVCGGCRVGQGGGLAHSGESEQEQREGVAGRGCQTPSRILKCTPTRGEGEHPQQGKEGVHAVCYPPPERRNSNGVGEASALGGQWRWETSHVQGIDCINK